MAIADVIKQHRTKNGLTQEEMARRLGVTAPAVNKWEKGNALPDVALLAPIARLLGITLDELLSFRDELTEEEVNRFLIQIRADLEIKPYDEVFDTVKRKIEEYPNCESLVWQAAMILHANKIATNPVNAREYEPVISGWFERCLLSDNEQIRKMGAEALFYPTFAEGDYEKASHYLNSYSAEDPERKRKEAMIKSKTGKREEAYRSYEELIFAGYQSLQLNLNDLRLLYMEDNDHDLAKKLVDVSSNIASAFEMGRYHEVSVGLDVAVWEKDQALTLKLVREILESTQTVRDFTRSSLYQHMLLKPIPDDYTENLLEKELLQIFDDDAFAFMQDNEDWQMLKMNFLEADTFHLSRQIDAKVAEVQYL